MNRWVARSLFLFCAAFLVQNAWAADQGNSQQANGQSGQSGQSGGSSQGSDVEKARKALAKKKSDQTSTKELEQVFNSAEKNYSLLRKGDQSLNYSFDYTYTANQRLDLKIVNNQVKNLDIAPTATHTFTNSFSYDYGFLNNLTLGFRVPLVAQYDTQRQISTYGIGDVSFTTRWQPMPYVPGKVSTTLFGSLTTKTGTSPYAIDVQRELSTGSGYYSVAGGASVSKVLDPVVIYGSGSISYNFPATNLNQVRGARLLQQVNPGSGISGSMGFSYSLSYDISLSASVQLSYSNQTTLEFSDGSKATAQSSMSGVMSFSLGTRVSEKTIVNTNVGFGLTPDSPDVSIGVSLPINFDGLKED